MSDRNERRVALRWRLLLAVASACLIVLVGAAGVEAQDPQREFSFTGRATINGEPAPLGTTIEIEVNGKIIGEGEVSGSDGKWIVQIDASLLQEGICEAVFYVNGQPADRQWNRCAVDIRLEVDPVVADEPEQQDAPEPQDDPDNQVEPDDPDDPDQPEEIDDPSDETLPIVQPRSPGTGTGGLIPEERQANGAIAAIAVVGVVALGLSGMVIFNRRSAWSR